MKMDAVFEAIGGFGPAQQRIYFAVCSAWIPFAWGMQSMVFVNSRPLWQDDSGIVHNTELPCGSEFQIANPYHTVQGEWQLICDNEWMGSLLNSVMFVGFGFGAALCGNWGDKLGRRKAFQVAVTVSACTTLASALAPTYRVYIVLRGLVGVAMGGLSISTFVLSSEFIGPAQRNLTGQGQTLIFTIGNVLLAPLAYFIQSWRLLTVVTALPFMFYVPLCSWVPESPRWLFAIGKHEEAFDVIRHIAEMNGAQMPDGMGICASPKSSDVLPQPCLKDLFSHPVLSRTVTLMYVWFTAAFVYYGLSLDAGNLGGGLYSSFFLMSCVESLCVPPSTWLCDRIGRRPTLAGFMLQTAVCCIACTLTASSNLSRAIAIAGKFGAAGSYSVLYVYSAELLPTVVRSLGIGVSSTMARVGGFLAPGVVLLATISESIPMRVFGGLACLAGTLILFLPETAGKPMPETMADIDAQGPGELPNGRPADGGLAYKVCPG
jgi:MFS family permease